MDGSNLSKTSLMLFVSIILIILLICYICKKEYNSDDNNRVGDMHYQSHIKQGDYPKMKLSKHQGIHNSDKTMLEKHKKIVEPEKNIMSNHSMGDNLHNTVKKMDDPLSLDEVIQISVETKDQQIKRSVDDNYENKQIEGMSAPIEEFEEGSLGRQLIHSTSVYS
jgi:hypothetical protein